MTTAEKSYRLYKAGKLIGNNINCQDIVDNINEQLEVKALFLEFQKDQLEHTKSEMLKRIESNESEYKKIITELWTELK